VQSASGGGGLAYLPGAGYDELVGGDGRPRALAEALWSALARLGPSGLDQRQRAADVEIGTAGVTFGAASEDGQVDRPWPFDVIPRVIDAAEWRRVEAGLIQRVTALNRFVDDVYHAQAVVRDGVVPPDLVTRSPNFRPECMGVDPPGGIWTHICGSDLVRDEDGTLYVLEDNLRVPSGASYLLENRLVTKHVFAELFRSYSVEPVDHYVAELGAMLVSLAPRVRDPRVVVLTPGVYNSAYYEHAFLAEQLGVDLVEGRDLVVADDDCVYARTIDGLERVHVVYRRVDDVFLDPKTFRRDSLVGVAGLARAWRAGSVALANAPGTGVADDKGLYPFVGDLIRYYLGDEPLLASVPTWRCADPKHMAFVLDNLDSLVVKPANESGGYGVVIGPQADAGTLQHVASRIEAHPAGWVAQPLLALSTMPTLADGVVAPRHVDLRPFTILGSDQSYVTPGGLTRVARQSGSLIVNSSQGGGSKDTWVVHRVLTDVTHPGSTPSDDADVTRSRPPLGPGPPTAGQRFAGDGQRLWDSTRHDMSQ
jgi:uncharacterized circularly permuted ATP-grasp superfamily protein